MKQFPFFSFFSSCLTVLVLSACSHDSALTEEDLTKKKTPLRHFLKEAHLKLPPYFSLEKLHKHIEADELEAASKYVNACLNVNVRHAFLHLLNGFIYEEMLSRGDTQKSELAGIAYRSAYTLDPSQWLSVYLLGAHELRSRRYKEAQRFLANALILKPNQPDILYSLAFASYYLHDIPVAMSSIARVVALKPQDPHINKAAAIIFAAGGQFNKAKKCLNTFTHVVGSDHPEVAAAERRLLDWQQIHNKAMSRQTVAETPDVEGVISRASEAVQDIAPVLQKQESSQAKSDAPTVVLDCYLLRSLEGTNTVRGQNIMDSLRVALGGIDFATNAADPIASVSRTLTTVPPPEGASNVTNNWIKNFNYQVNPVVLKYSLDIANAYQQFIEVNVRPTISTVVGKPAYFLDGTQYVGAAGGGSGSSIASVDAGIRLEVTPTEVTPEGQIVLDISIAGSLFIKLPDEKRSIAVQTIGTTRSNISSTVRATFGQTIMIGGLYSRANVTTKQGFPLLQDIPLLQYFFANETVDSEVQSSLFLVTVRRGGSEEGCMTPEGRIDRPSDIMKELQHCGLMSIGEYPTLYYILKALANSQLFADFRSGDLSLPFWGYDHADLKKKLDQLSAFILF